ncbi:hypothetical protein KC343_g12538 [Hortaea werneckii]|nr:hypothetical protein KC352_g22968 [Hortaea werneckii]KAI7555772.1 hypothetical protein KC317_g12722 [Hortaea werneckii]KAI7602185.1 hypothetical protein KC346_g12482 [Hortaea werneckii]KAI7608829.1 hypothetical protein KC343_g12538 [Hortaea werneckii]KAI7644578.1 hypothetical protein KC319_g12264 [Hortaea werneckii]
MTDRASRSIAARMATTPHGIDLKISSPPAPRKRSGSSLEWIFLEDCEIFDNATTDFLREHFNQWKSAKLQREQQRATRPTETMLLKTPRYRYFIRVNREALDSVLSAPGNWDADPESTATGWVHVVDSICTAEMDDVDSDTEECDMLNLDFEPIEDCRREDVGWMKVATRSICTELYSLMDDPEMWRVIYKRPPEMAVV